MRIVGLALTATMALVATGCGGGSSTGTSTSDLVTTAPAALHPGWKTETQAERFLSHIKSYAGIDFEIYSEQPNCHGRDDEQDGTTATGETIASFTSFDCWYYAQDANDGGHSFKLFVRPQVDGTWVVVGDTPSVGMPDWMA